MSKQKILVSACLLGKEVRYNGKAVEFFSSKMQQWQAEDRIVSVCPEVCAGLPIPRPPAEIQCDGSVKTICGKDVSDAFKKGAQTALALALQYDIKLAILAERSPSCGSAKIYNGEFTGTLIDGEGLTTQLLRAQGIQVFSQFELDKVKNLLMD